jgi:hypothetical protein
MRQRAGNSSDIWGRTARANFFLMLSLGSGSSAQLAEPMMWIFSMRSRRCPVECFGNVLENA